jgi:hypothetical protein
LAEEEFGRLAKEFCSAGKEFFRLQLLSYLVEEEFGRLAKEFCSAGKEFYRL